MQNQRLALGLALFALAGCAASQNRPAEVASAGCAQLGDVNAVAAEQLQPGQVYGAKEVRERVFLARALQPERTVGADLYVLAQPNVTPEYLQRTLTCHAASGRALSANDPFHPERGHVASVQVRGVDNGYAVRILGSDRDAARDIWERARSFTDPGSVTVEQVARTEAKETSL